MEHNFRVGQKVRIRTPRPKELHDDRIVFVTSDMIAMNGEIHTIESISNIDDGLIINLKNVNWNWDATILVPYEGKIDKFKKEIMGEG